MLKPKPDPLNWLIDFLATRWAQRGKYPKELLIEKMKEAIADRELPTTTWVVEWPDGTRSAHPIVERYHFVNRDWERTGSCIIEWQNGTQSRGRYIVHSSDGPRQIFECVFDTDRPLPEEDVDDARGVQWGSPAAVYATTEEKEEVWPPELFEDCVESQEDNLTRRWVAHTGQQAADFFQVLKSAQLGPLYWQEKKRHIPRPVFAKWWLEASSLSNTPSAIAETPRAVTVDDLWPPDRRSAPWATLEPREAAERALDELFRDNLPDKITKKVRNALDNYSAERGGPSPIGHSTYQRALREIHPSSTQKHPDRMRVPDRT